MPATIPSDRTKKQPIVGYCLNPECRELSTDERFEFVVEHEVCCPKCGATNPPLVDLLVLIHFLHANKQGRIVGSMGMRYSIACDPKRSHTATVTNLEAASGDLRAVNCPGCQKAAFDMKLAEQQGKPITPTF
jgi:hypothetical protein